jgi:hypothetical protein
VGRRDFVDQRALERRNEKESFMRRRNAISPIKIMPSRSLAWAARLGERHLRFADWSRLNMLLCLPALARTLVSLQQRCFTSQVNFHHQLNLSYQQGNVFNQWTRNVSAQQLTLLSLLSLADRDPRTNRIEPEQPIGPRSSTVEDVRTLRFVSDYQNRKHLALTLAVNRTSTDLSTTLSNKFLMQREAQVREVSTLLTQRSRRIDESSVQQTALAFRAPVASGVSVIEPSLEVARSRDAFERRSNPLTTPQITPPAFNVDQLADEVMRQIDRRVIARRERMGQI